MFLDKIIRRGRYKVKSFWGKIFLTLVGLRDVVQSLGFTIRHRSSRFTMPGLHQGGARNARFCLFSESLNTISGAVLGNLVYVRRAEGVLQTTVSMIEPIQIGFSQSVALRKAGDAEIAPSTPRIPG